MTSRLVLLLLAVAVAGTHGCIRSQPRPLAEPPVPVVEDHLTTTSSAATQGNAWSGGSGGIDWTPVGPGGQPSSNRGTGSSSRRGSSSPGGSSRGSSGGSSRGSSRGSPTSPQSVSRNELRRLSGELFNLDTNAVGSMLTLNLQGRTSSSNSADMASQSLFSNVPPAALSGPTIAPLLALLDNYIPSVTQAETDTSQEVAEQAAFLDAVTATAIMRRTEEFLRAKGLITRPIREVLREIWFTPYTRSRRVVGTSGFEHVFVGEIKQSKVSGFHNWVSFYNEEQQGDLNYFGYMKTVDLGSQADIILLKFNWENDRKPLGSMFVGTSPELDMALYTVCFYARPGNNCPMELHGQRFNIKTHYQNYNGKKYVGTAYPNI